MDLVLALAERTGAPGASRGARRAEPRNDEHDRHDAERGEQERFGGRQAGGMLLRERANPFCEAPCLGSCGPCTDKVAVKTAKPQAAGLPECLGGDRVQDLVGQRRSVRGSASGSFRLSEREGSRRQGRSADAGLRA